uniref:Glycine zipper domain-containing protein n=1 Tax=Arion vulgaris TaxID=1028688 RepID=A0A0B7ASV7_9EUPU
MAEHLLGMAFIPYYDNLMNLLKTNPELHKTAKGIFKQVSWTAAGTVAGAVVGGPFGAMIGGIAGSLVGYRMSDDYQSMIDVLQDISDEDKAELVKRVQELVGATSLEALTRFIGAQAQRSALIGLLRSAVSEFAKGG